MSGDNWLECTVGFGASVPALARAVWGNGILSDI